MNGNHGKIGLAITMPRHDFGSVASKGQNTSLDLAVSNCKGILIRGRAHFFLKELRGRIARSHAATVLVSFFIKDACESEVAKF